MKNIKRDRIQALYNEYDKTKQLKHRMSYADYITRRVNLTRKKSKISEDVSWWDALSGVTIVRR